MSNRIQSGVEVIIKLGGCAITNKDELESVNLAAIERAARIVNDLAGRCVVVHGAGSFGHFQAHEYGTARGFGNDLERGKTGFVKTRLSVTKLLHLISEVFVNQGIPAVGLSPCGTWVTTAGQVTTSAVSHLADLIAAGFVPIIHGDCVLDTKQGCAILSGDKIIETFDTLVTILENDPVISTLGARGSTALSSLLVDPKLWLEPLAPRRLVEELQPKRVVFLTDVDGIYDRPPEQQGSELLQHIEVNKNGEIAVAIATKSLGHDVTGGVKEKLRTAANIVTNSRGVTAVFVTNVMSDCAYDVCVKGCTTEDKGTKIVMQ